MTKESNMPKKHEAALALPFRLPVEYNGLAAIHDAKGAHIISIPDDIEVSQTATGKAIEQMLNTHARLTDAARLLLLNVETASKDCGNNPLRAQSSLSIAPRWPGAIEARQILKELGIL
jgi:hypothetical protein